MVYVRVTHLITYDSVCNQLMSFIIEELCWKALGKCDSSVHEVSVGPNSKGLLRSGLYDICLIQHDLV
jgi:hypothetical protein